LQFSVAVAPEPIKATFPYWPGLPARVWASLTSSARQSGNCGQPGVPAGTERVSHQAGELTERVRDADVARADPSAAPDLNEPTDTALNCDSFSESQATIAIAVNTASRVAYQRPRGGAVTPYRHRIPIGLGNHRHDNWGKLLLQAPHSQHFQGRQAAKPAQAAQLRQLLPNMGVGHGWRHATETPRNRSGSRTLLDRRLLSSIGHWRQRRSPRAVSSGLVLQISLSAAGGPQFGQS
jgi:hypothetical protein